LGALERQACAATRRAARAELFLAQAAAWVRAGVPPDSDADAEPTVTAAQKTIVRVVARRLRGAGTLSVSAGHRILLSASS
jgi:hypothetical protein